MKILDWSKLKAFADDKIKVLEMMMFLFNRVENIVGKGENAGYQHFFLFPQCFQRALYLGSFSGLYGMEFRSTPSKGHLLLKLLTSHLCEGEWIRKCVYRGYIFF